ncbi:MAG: (S)-ureidoglycine aminohydrolase [Solirubrobacteraceae bacterium]|jgi:(S)-ureidoglycine aminohydrolase|nr:(S)-ureidoglycine aminohydrolase [Solirubrobacteraceae bacterium]
MSTTIAGSRGRRGAAYHVLTPPNRYPSRLAGWPGTVVFKLATPRTGTARFGQYLLELAPSGGCGDAIDPGFEHVVLVQEGAPLLDGRELATGAFAYIPPGAGLALTNPDGAPSATVVWVKRRYESAAGHDQAGALRGTLGDLPEVLTPSGVLRRELLPPDDPAFDFNMSLMTFPPGVDLGMVEVHDEEHGLLMTAGAGCYHLDGDDHELVAGDFVYMAPYCPQFFRPHGATDAQYLLYKDVFRDGF